VENLYKRTPEQIAEENALMAEVKRIEAYDKKARADREDLINLLESPRTMGDTRGYEGSQGMNILFQTLVAADKTRVKQQQRKQSVSQVNVPQGQATTQDSAMNAREEVTRRFRRFSPKEGTQLKSRRADGKNISLVLRIQRRLYRELNSDLQNLSFQNLLLHRKCRMFSKKLDFRRNLLCQLLSSVKKWRNYMRQYN